jgi:hypothetical protein
LLRAQIQVESGGNPNAVSNQNAQGISQIIPATAQSLKVDPFDPTQAIDGQARLMAENLQRYGTAEKAVLAYHGGTDQANWGPKTQAYLQKVTAAYGGQSMPKQQSGDPFLDMADAVAGPKDQKTAPQGSGDSFLDMADSVQASPKTPQMTAQQIDAQSTPAPEKSAGDRFMTGVMAAPKGIYQGFRAVTDTGLQGASRAVDALAGTNYAAQADANAAKAKADFEADYGGNNLTGTIARGSKVGGEIAATYPALGAKIAQSSGVIANLINGAVQGGAFNALTSSQSDEPLWKQVVEGAAVGAPANALLGFLAKTQVGQDFINAIGSKANDLRKAITGDKTNPFNLPPVQATGPEMAATRDATAQRVTEEQAAASAAKPKFKMNTDGSMTPIPKTGDTTAVPVFTPPQAASSGTAGAAQRAQNEQIVKDIGLDSARPSAISGDKRAAGVEYQQSKLQTSQGEVLNQQLQKEQAALKGYGQKIISDTGATASTPEQVGQSVKAPLQALSDHYDTQIGQLYSEANARAGGEAIVQPDNFNKLVSTDSMFAGKNENVALRRGIRAYMKEQGIGAEPVTVQQAEGMRQYLNSQWSPQNSGLIGKIKESLDSDVGQAGGADIYKAARALHAERANTLDNPKGIASLLNESGPGGINQAVPDEKVGSKILTMPTAQYQHVVSTLKNLPPELQPQGQQALAEIKGQIAKKIYAAGDSGGTQNGPSNWNAANVTKTMNELRSKMNIFSPEEIAQIQTLHDAGHILQTPSAYPGAAVQTHNLAQKGLLYAASPTGGAFLGGHIAGPSGAMAGAALGASANNLLAKRFEQAMANKLQQSMMLR